MSGIVQGARGTAVNKSKKIPTLMELTEEKIDHTLIHKFMIYHRY